jgi:hypothetical protein
MTRVPLMADLPPAEQPHLQVIDTRSPAFATNIAAIAVARVKPGSRHYVMP